MESNKIKELQDALCDIRKAHRLICSFQQRMLDLAQFIKMKFDMPSIQIYKQFSYPVKNGRNMLPDMWAWDFLYSYQLEYYFDYKECGQYKYTISLLQCVDTGYFDVEDSNKKNPDTFAAEEDSATKLVFYVNRVLKSASECKLWDKRNELFDTKKYMRKDFSAEVIDYPEEKEMVLLFSLPIERFIDEQSTIIALQEFTNYCNENLNLNIKII